MSNLRNIRTSSSLGTGSPGPFPAGEILMATELREAALLSLARDSTTSTDIFAGSKSQTIRLESISLG